MPLPDASTGGGTAVSGGSSGGGWWNVVLDNIGPIMQGVGAVADAVIGNQGADSVADAQTQANTNALALTRDIYNDQRSLYMPQYRTGGDAMNLLARIYGLPAQDYGAAAAGSGAGGAPGGARLPNYGAGQPVVGHSGGGGVNALTSAAGSAIGSTFGGPIGGFVGGALGSMFRNGGDNWQTLATEAEPGYNWTEYMTNSPDLQAEWANPDVQALFGGNRDAYASWHHRTMGRNEGRVVNPLQGSAQAGGGTAGGTGGSTGSAATGAYDMNEFYNSPDGKIAISGFRGVDVPETRGAFAAGGKLLSGAQSKALDDRGKARMGAAWDSYTNGIRSLAGVTQTASQQMGASGDRYGATAGGIIRDNGLIQANRNQQVNNNWRTAAGNALSGWV